LKTTVLSRAILPNGEDWMEKTLGKGKVLFAALPLELNANLQAVADVYSYALKAANIDPVYSTTLKDHGILICPTLYPRATLYVLTSESNRTDISF
jgi:RecA-family ATPase